MRNDTEPNWRLLASYLSGEATSDDLIALEQWVRGHAERESLLQELRRSWQIPEQAFKAPFDLASIEHSVFLRIAVSGETAPQANDKTVALTTDTLSNGGFVSAGPAKRLRPSFERPLGTRPLPLASKIRGVLGRQSLPSEPQILRRGWTRLTLGLITAGALLASTSVLYRTFREGKPMVTSHVYVTARAQRLSVVLGNGANVVLAPETWLRYTVDDRNIRSVELVGEAFFTVTHDSRQPFVVRSGTVTTRVLGTAFDVRRYPGDRVTQVAVVSGRVTAGGGRSPVILGAGAVGYLTDSSATVKVGADPEQSASWTQGNLIFHNAPAATVLATLGRWYGYEFRLTDTTLASTQISIGVSTDQPSQALNMVKAVLGVSMTFEGNIVTLRPERTNRSMSPKKSIRGLSTYPESEVGK